MTRLRRLTAEGMERARAFLNEWRENPEHREPPEGLLYGERYSRPFAAGVELEQRPFRTRRSAAEYLSPRLAPIKNIIVDRADVWSWLGMFYFEGTAPIRSDNRNTRLESFVFSPEGGSTTEETRSYQGRYRHYLRGAWRLYEQHGEAAEFLLDEPIDSFSDLANRVFQTSRIFNSRGVVQLILHLYTDGDRRKSGYVRSLGGLRHLIRVLDQLERTYDVYGMEQDALLRILPTPFQRWAAAA